MPFDRVTAVAGWLVRIVGAVVVLIAEVLAPRAQHEQEDHSEFFHGLTFMGSARQDRLVIIASASCGPTLCWPDRNIF